MAKSPKDIAAAQRLRYLVFVKELGGDGPLVDHAARLERDTFDPYAGHLMLLDETRSPDDQVVGVYRLMTTQMAQKAGRFYSEEEYDLRPLRESGRRLLELGRSCLHPDYRGGTGMLHLWAGLADYVANHGIEVMFGVASFHGTDADALAGPLSLLHHRHSAPDALRVRAIGPTALNMNMQAADRLDRLAAVRAMPPLIKGYLRLGATVGDGAFVDHDFNTVDVCLILEHEAINALQKSIYTKGAARG
ncbi:GNAT family N-acetyltransferase [Loktanella sp. Alg231-35]|uniref:GNAT family N-acetyltransferase n=1 Tax=Loktanella sp. Alg231-35 TaxID=1922220 RepID=UPI001F3FE7B3|nr:GNAT family N-acyltransferase [Loktanella sp. Alg231-35]